MLRPTKVTRVPEANVHEEKGNACQKAGQSPVPSRRNFQDLLRYPRHDKGGYASTRVHTQAINGQF